MGTTDKTDEVLALYHESRDCFYEANILLHKSERLMAEFNGAYEKLQRDLKVPPSHRLDIFGDKLVKPDRQCQGFPINQLE